MGNIIFQGKTSCAENLKQQRMERLIKRVVDNNKNVK